MTVSNDTGGFNLPGLTPAVRPYRSLQGFKQYASKDLTLQVDQNANFDRSRGGRNDGNSRGDSPGTRKPDPSLGAVVDTQKILGAFNGRNFVELALLVPGANTGAPGAGGGGGFRSPEGAVNRMRFRLMAPPTLMGLRIISAFALH
ncbi:MAG: carboxypeptidase-like regulatory domain-containing protein [Bryobacteraceae bacterium]